MSTAAFMLGAALAAPRDPQLPQLEAPLRQEWARHQKGAPPLLPWALPELADAHSVRVTLELAPGAQPHPAVAELGGTALAAADLEDGTRWVLVAVPWDALPSLASLAGVRRARLPHPAREKRGAGDRGAIVTEGLGAIFRDGDWIDEGLDGGRVDVVIADVGFSGAETLVGDELPRRTRMSAGEEASATAHGTAVAEIVNDLSPGVRVRLKHFGTGVEFLALIDGLAAERRAELVNGSIGFDNVWPADGTSPYTRAVDRLPEAGALWIGAAGNEGGRYLAGEVSLQDGGLTVAGEPGAWVPVVDGVVEANLRWSEPMRGAAVDLDLAAYDELGDRCGVADDPQDGGDSAPLETLIARCPGRAAWVQLERGTADTDPTGLSAWIYAPWGLSPSVVAPGTGVLTLPADTRTGVAVGACDRDADEAPTYSSWGPTEDGRTKPDLCAPDGVSTESYGERGFLGTSAATPHATGLAALLSQAERLRGEPSALRVALLAHTVDLGPAGPDDTFGVGALDAGPIPEGCHCASAPGRLPGLALALLGLLVGARRGRGAAGSRAWRSENPPLA